MKTTRFAAVLLAVLVLSVAAVAQKPQENPTVQLNGGLEAQILSLGRSNKGYRIDLNAAIKITNTGKDTAFIMFYGAPSAFDSAGTKFENFDSLTGVAYCGTNPPGLCVGLPRYNEAYLFPLRGYTQIDPGRSVTLHLTLWEHGLQSKGDQASVSAQMAYRIVSDLTKDADLTDEQQFKQVRIGNLSFEPTTISEK